MPHDRKRAAAAGLERVDLVQIDAEGFDWPIIRSIDFARLRPAIIRFEYRNMPARDADACLELLAAHGYRFLIEPRDIIAHRSAVRRCIASGRAAYAPERVILSDRGRRV